MNLAQNTGDQIARLNRSGKPIAVIHAAEDLAVRLEYLEKLEINNLWEQKIQIVHGCGHYIIAEKPAELASLLDRFFTVS